MKAPEQCASLKERAKSARKAVWKEKLLSPARKKAHDKSVAANKKFQACKKEHGKAGAILFSRGLARAAKDSGVRFGLKPDFHKTAGPFKVDDAVQKAFKVKKAKDAAPKAKAFAKKHDLTEAVKYATIVEGLKDAKTGATAGFITAQVGAAVLDVLVGIGTLGAYAAAAPAVHAAIGAGQKVTTDMINKDIARNEEMYAAAISKRKAKIRAKELEKEAAAVEKQAAELEVLQKSAPAEAAPAPVPWYRTKAALAAGGAIAVLGLFAIVGATRRE